METLIEYLLMLIGLVTFYLYQAKHYYESRIEVSRRQSFIIVIQERWFDHALSFISAITLMLFRNEIIMWLVSDSATSEFVHVSNKVYAYFSGFLNVAMLSHVVRLVTSKFKINNESSSTPGPTHD